MDISGIREIKKQIDTENFRAIHGCYVNVAGEIVSNFEIAIPDMTAEEKEMYTKIFRKTLSGKQDKNLTDIDLGDEYKPFLAIADSGLKNKDLRDALYAKIINSLEYDRNYCILLASGTYDVQEESEYTYFLCSICPIKESKAELRYREKQFRGDSTGSILQSPVLGFLYPAFVERAADVCSCTYYFNKELHEELIEELFRADIPKTAEDMKEEFQTTLTNVLDDNYDVPTAAAIYSDIISRSEDGLDVTIDTLSETLKKKDISDEKIDQLIQTLGEDYSCDPDNLIEKKYVITTSDTTITTAPENALRIKLKEIDGKTYILVPSDASLAVNGVEVLPGEEL